ncbi:MAG: hypothetical protein NVS1B16_08830 [Pseudarthrobacter sp.]
MHVTELDLITRVAVGWALTFVLGFERADNNTILKRLNRDRHSDLSFYVSKNSWTVGLLRRGWQTVVAVPAAAWLAALHVLAPS